MIKTEKPLVSVIIACFDAEKFIDRCLKSVVNQTYQNIEIIICDDCSKDNSLQILYRWKESDSRIKVLNNKVNCFAGKTRNRCINIAKGDYILIQDIDDISKPNRIENLLRAMADNDIDFVGSAMEIIDSNTRSGEIMRQNRTNPTKSSFYWNIPFSHPSMLFSTDSIRKVSGYRVAKETRRGQDYDMLMRLYALGYIGMNLNEVLYGYCIDENNFKRRTWTARIGECKIRYKGFKEMKMLYPFGLVFVLKPIFVFIVQKITELSDKNDER